jgi:hypothetical protein
MKNPITLIVIALFVITLHSHADYNIEQLDHSWQFWTADYPSTAGQSFTTYGSGQLTHLEIWKRTDFSSTLKIYLGQSLDPLDEIYSQMVTTSGGPGSEVIELEVPLYVDENSIYTFAISEGSDADGSFLTGGGNLYDDGEAFQGFWWSSSDFYFRALIASAFEIPNQWIGAVNSNWNHPANWNDNVIPHANADVIIGDGFPNYPIINGEVFSKSISLKGNASLTIEAEAILNITTDLIIGAGQGGTFIINGGNCIVNGNVYSRTNSTISVFDGNFEFENWVEGSSYWEYPKGDITLSGGDIHAKGNLKFYYGIDGVMDGPFNLIVNGDFGSVAEYWTVTDGTIMLTGAAGDGPFQCYSNSVFNYNTIVAHNMVVNAPGKEFHLCNDNGPTNMHILNKLDLQAGHLTTYSNSMDDISAFVSVEGNVTIGPEGSFTAVVADSFNIAGDYLIQSNSNSTGSWIDNDKLKVKGNSIVESYLSEDAWHYISSPVSNALSQVFLDIYLRNWDEASYAWNPYITNLSDPLVPGMGFASWSMSSSTGNTIVEYNGGQVNGGDLLLPLTATDSDLDLSIGAGEGWNFVGNPFPSAVDWNASWQSVNISPTAYFWDGSLGASGNYSTWNYFTNTGVNKADGTIASGQGFFVKATDFDPLLVVPQSERFHANDAFLKNGNNVIEKAGITNSVINGKPVILDHENNSLMIQNEHDKIDIGNILNSTVETESQNSFMEKAAEYKAPKMEFTSFKVKVEGSEGYDETLLLFSDRATKGYDPLFDAFKIKGISSAPQIYIPFSGSDYSMKSYQEITEELIIPLAFEAKNSGEYSLQLSNIAQIGRSVYLKDLLADKIVEISDSEEYVFWAAPDGLTDRFLLRFANPLTGIDCSEKLMMESQIYSHKNEIYILMEDHFDGKVIVYNLLGEEIARLDQLSAGLNKISLNSIKGFVIARLINGNEVQTKKLYISE